MLRIFNIRLNNSEISTVVVPTNTGRPAARRISTSSILEYLNTFKEEVTNDGIYIVIGALLAELQSRISNCTQDRVMQLLQERSLPEAPLSKSKLTKIFAPANKKYDDFRK